ncbi:prepilin-type N-terminal cleavage/methylation domain-containing protein [Azoarcus sp. L1K30]|uniref:type II secretion system protein GspJ n=1 Tax=Azoarcus sp. L1K30 TaxID=2820277 RepID=UPI001B8424E3|nr:type II secretion system protein GspJ [Azoarcus sp. L1K30]MBR0565818.1 prepilin-type N-terminal cleavage/methylation domain-containing protein [Azoarcus sp. L1K30]
MSAIDHQRARGLTLIELVIALALFAILGTLTWRATAQVIDTRARVSREIGRWQDIASAMQRIEMELQQIAAPALPPAGTAASPALELLRISDDGHSELRLLALGASGEGARRIGLRFTGTRLDWLIWPDRNARTGADTYLLLDGVRAIRWHFIGKGERHDRWPVAGRAGDTLPAAIELELETTDDGTFTRLVALR